MDDRDAVLRLVSELPERSLSEARRLLVRLRMEQTLAEAASVEPETGELEALQESRDARERGDVLSHDELKRSVGLK